MKFCRIFLKVPQFCLTVGFCALAYAGQQDIRTGLVEMQNAIVPQSAQAALVEKLVQSLDSYEAIQNYEAIFYKTESEGGKLETTEKIFLKFEKPFKIFMKWLNTAKDGLQVLYERGHHDGKLVIHKPGLFFGLVPVVFLDPSSPWVREGSASYNIEDAGIGTFLNDTAKAVLCAFRENKLRVRLHGRTHRRFEVAFPGSKKGSEYFAYRIVLLFDKDASVPVRMMLFDWNGKLMGVYFYKNLKINVADDSVFKKHAQNQLFKIYKHIE